MLKNHLLYVLHFYVHLCHLDYWAMPLNISNSYVLAGEVLTFALAFSEKLNFIPILQRGSEGYDLYVATLKSQFLSCQWLFNEWDFEALGSVLWKVLVFKNFFLDSIASNFRGSMFRIDYLNYSIYLLVLIRFVDCKITHSFQVFVDYSTIVSSSK